MPEAFTYYDLQRRLAAAIPTPTRFRLETYDINARLEGSTPQVRALTGKAKKQLRDSRPELFRPKTSNTYINYDIVPEQLRQNIILQGNEVQSYGKRIGIPLGHQFWMRIHLYMHGHVIIMPGAQLQRAITQWKNEPGPEYSHPHIQLALVNLSNPSGPCIAVIDSMRLSSMTFIRAPSRVSGPPQDQLVNAWRDHSLGPCPIRRLDDFLDRVRQWNPPRSTLGRPIYKVLCANQKMFNGIGTSHSVEILHRAMIHPEETTGTVFNHYRENLLNGMRLFFEIAHSSVYTSQISPAFNTGGSAFYEPLYITMKINQRWLQVYRQTVSHTLVKKDHYDYLHARGWLDPKCQPWGSMRPGNRDTRDTLKSRKRIQVYCIHVPNIKAFVYTVIYRPRDFAGTYLPADAAMKKALGQGNPDIGPSSFFDTVRLEKSEKGLRQRRHTLHTGMRGRPRKTKRIIEERQLLHEQVPANVPEFQNPLYEEEDEEEESSVLSEPPEEDDEEDVPSGMSAVAQGKQRAVSRPAPVPGAGSAGAAGARSEDEDDNMRLDIMQDIMGQGRNLSDAEIEEEYDLEDLEDAESDIDSDYQP